MIESRKSRQFGNILNYLRYTICALLMLAANPSFATTFTMTVPGTSLVLPAEYPQAGGVAIVMIGANGNAYYQFSNPTGAFVGYNNNGTPVAFQGNPFTINNPIALNCGFSSCTTYFGGSIARVYIRFTALDGDTQAGGFDHNDITLRLNGFDVANWSTITTQTTNTAGTTALSTQLGFGNNTFDTGWFQSANPALMANILSTGRTTTQVFDRDPNDNYWDFRQGGTLTNNNVVTVAPGYSLTKTASPTTFTAVGQVINYSYVVTNIGSVRINNLTVADDKIASVTCNKNFINAVPFGSTTPDSATCTGTYIVTQADFDAERVVNIAQARGVPEFGTLGGLTATATVTGPTIRPTISLTKSTTLGAFGAVGTTVPYSFRVENSGDATLTNVVVTDPKVPALSCTFATMAPGAVQTCTANYTVQQADMDAFAAGTNLVNTASVTSLDPKNVARTATSTVSLPGPTPVLTMFVDKTTTATTYNAAGQVLPYQILVRNTGNITWPAAPTVADTKTTVSCPAGAVAPGSSITCTANYTVLQADLDSGTLPNTATGSITVGSRNATANDTVTLTATRTTGLTIDKRLAAASPTSFNNTGIGLTYAYDLVNTGNVTLNTVAVTDNKVAVTCPATTLAPAATMTCTSAAYLTTQADLNAGSVVNIASASATAAGTNTVVTSAADTVTVPAVQQPALTLVKTAPVLAAPQFVVDGVVTYSFEVTNSGNIDLPSATQISVTDDKIGTFNCGSGVLLRNETRTCTATYTLTATDILAGLVVNTATAAAGPTTSNQVTATISPTLAPAITLVKTATPANIDATSDVISYTFTITNSGDSQILRSGQPIAVNDPMVGAVDCSAQPAILAPNESFACTATYSATQAQLNAGQVVNSATASFPFTSGGTTTTITAPTSTATVPVIETTGLTLDKTGPANFTSVGQVISYGFAVTNNGNTTLTSTTVTDPKLPALSCTLADIAPGATRSCTGNYTVTQADMDAGSIFNTATAQGRTESGGSATDTDDVTVPVSPTVTLKSATLVKDASRSTFTAVGEPITYTMRVANDGAQTLRDITVTDVLDAGFSCAIPLIEPGVTNSDCNFTYIVTQADFDAGQVVNTASAAIPGLITLTNSRTVTGPTRTADFILVKSASGPFTAAGQTVDFTFTLTNTGNVSLSNLQVTDPFFSPSLSCTVPSLLPGATSATCTGSYLVTQADVDRGSITNTATASASAPAGVTAPTNKTSTVVVNGPTRAPAVQIVKTPSATTYAAVSNVISYAFTVTNTGNVTLSNLTVTDAALDFSCALDTLAPGASTTTCAGGAPALTDSKMIGQADIDLGTYSNTARVAGRSLIGAVAVSDTDTVMVTGPVQSPAINLVKATTLAGTFDSVGQVVPYTYTIQNTGNITLTGTFTVSDDKIAAVTCPATPVTGIAPLASLTCTGSYTITQDDLDANEVVNVATASTSQPVIPTNPGDPALVALTDTDTETVLADQLPALSLQKRVKASSLSSYTEVGDPITFEYIVTNTGNVTTTGPITITDDKIPGSLPCGAAGIPPGGTFTCEQVWLADQAALDAGEVTNSAVASMVFDGAPVDSAADTATVTAVQEPSLAIEKTFTGTSAPGVFNVGDVLSYSFVITNNGNVTIDGPLTLADSLTSPICPALPGNQLAPDDMLICRTTHTVTQNDIDLGAATNVVSVTGSFDGAPVVSPSDDAIYPLAATSALTLTKEAVAGAIPFNAAGQVITYRYSIDNTGNVGLSQALFITDDKLGGGPRLCRAAAIFSTTDPVVTCEFDYEVTQIDVDRGFVTNNAVASTVYAPNGPATNVVSPNATATVPATENPALTVTKAVTAGPSPAAVGDSLTYTITTTNTGNQTISGVAVSDAKVGPLTCTFDGAPAPANVVLLPREALVCQASYEVTQQDVDDQVLVNVANARGSDPQGAVVAATDTVTHPLVAPLALVEVSKAVTPEPGPDDAFSTVGQPVTFAVTVRNTGNVTLSETTVTDDLLPTESCAVPSLAPMQVYTGCTFTVIATQADIDAIYGPTGAPHGGIENTVTAISLPANPGALPVSDTGEAFAKGPTHGPALTLAKAAVTTTFDAFGDTITYEFIVANAGNITLTADLMVNDPLLGAPFACGPLPIGGLPPREFVTCTRTYQVTQADVDRGIINNTATVSSTEAPLPTDDDALAKVTSSAEVIGARNPAVTVDKLASITADAKVGDVITYDYIVTNSGNVTLTGVTLNDQHTSAAGTVALAVAGDALQTDTPETGTTIDARENGIWDQLGPGDVVTFTASYTVTQADIDAGGAIANTVTVTANSPLGPLLEPDTDTVTIPLIAAAPLLDVVKTADLSGLSSPAGAGNEIAYTFTVRNAGNVTLSNLGLSDTLLRADGTVLALSEGPTFVSGDTGVIGPMEPDEQRTYEARYVLTQADIDAGGISNQARATAITPAGATVSDLSDDDVGADGDDPTRTVLPATPSIVAEKTITSAATEVGDTVEFLVTAANTGNVTLRAVGVASDTLRRADGTVLALTSGPSFRGATLGSPAGVLQPGELARYLATYVVTQADVDAGGITNTATVTGTPPVGPAVTDVSDNGIDTDGNTTDDLTELTFPAQPALDLVKRLATGSGPSFNAVGQLLDFDFTVTNTGNVTLAGPVTVSDPLIAAAGGVVDCPAGPLAPLASMNCTSTYTVTQADIDAGQIVNTATASANGTVTDPATATVLAVQRPSLTMTKTAQDLPAASFVVGAQVNYTYVVTNSGNVTITAPITVADNRIAANDITCPALPPGGLAPAASLSCTAIYTVTTDDVDLGVVTNLATASAGTTTSPIATESIPDNATPALSIEKRATSGADFAAVGDVISYSYLVTNSGTRSFVNPITVTDDKLGEISCFTPSSSDPDLRSGETVSCTASHIVTQDDLDLGRVVNQAYATTRFGANAAEVTSAPDTVTVQALSNPEISLTKTATPNPVTAVGQVVTYAFNVLNSGNQTLRNIVVVDAMLPNLSCQVSRLLPGQNLQCEAPYTVTQADVDRGTLINTATAEGITPDGEAVADSATETTTLPAADPSVTLEKQAIPTPFGAAGTTLTYAFTVTNTGNVTLTNLVVTDPMDPAFDCSIARLAPLAVNQTCQFDITVTQAQVDAGTIANTANLVASIPAGGTITAEDSIVTPGAAPAPGIEATKVLVSAGPGLGDELRYRLIVRNTGGVTLTPVDPVDTMTRLDGTSTALDSAFVLVSGDANTNGRLELAEVWIYEGSHTLTQEDIDAGGVSNTASISATTPGGDTVSDVSDNGNDADGNTADDPTVFVPQTGPALEVTKTVTAAGDAVGETVSFSILATNTGGVTLANIAILDDLRRLDGAEITGLVLEGGVSTLAPGEVGIWTLNHMLTQADVDAGGIQNSATVTGSGPDGRPATDISDNGNDVDGNITDDATLVPIGRAPALTVLKRLDRIGVRAGEAAVFTITATNTGNVGLTRVVSTDMLRRFDGTVLPSPTPVFASNSEGSPEGSLLPNEIATWTVTHILTQEDIDAGGLSNSALVTSVTPLGSVISDVSDDDGTGTSDPTIAVVNVTPALTATKTADRNTAVFGETVNYTLTFLNSSARTFNVASILDILPSGLTYTPGSATVNGVPVAPRVTGQQLAFGPLDVAPADTVVVRLSARVTGDAVGEMTNRALMLDAAGVSVSNEATATIRIVPEAVFECTDIIGKVYDDINRDGHPDGRTGLEPLTNDDIYVGGKLGKLSPPQPATKDYEPGLPGVRLVTVNGLLITTDAFGRFHVPCAALPKDAGSNFILKLDTRTLPQGYITTTENPRVMRVTPGKVSKMNFGAALANVIDIDLTAEAFEETTGAPSKALLKAIKDLVKDIKTKPTALNLTYQARKSETTEQAMARLKAAEKALRKAWFGVGAYRLNIERSVRRVQ
jgi:large repetitive protein